MASRRCAVYNRGFALPTFLPETPSMHVILMALLALEAGAVTDQYQARTYTYAAPDGTSHAVKYRLLSPEKIEPDKKYPLVLFLHGAGERGDDNKSQLKYFPEWMAAPGMRAKYPCFILAPQCPNNEKWVDVPWDKKTSQEMPKNPSQSMQHAIGMMDELIKTQPIDKHRIYLTGLSMGGYGTWDLAMRMPDRFAAIAPCCGGGDVSKAELLVNIPIFCYHGDADPAVPVERSRAMVEAIKKAGGHPKYTELPGVGHDCWTTAYKDPKGVVPWIFEQAKK
jgi:predicted peptidase